MCERLPGIDKWKENDFSLQCDCIEAIPKLFIIQCQQYVCVWMILSAKMKLPALNVQNKNKKKQPAIESTDKPISNE